MYSTAIVGAVGLGLGALILRGGSPPPSVLDSVPLTHDRTPKYITSPLVTSGGQVYYREQLGLTSLAVAAHGGEPRAILGTSGEFLLVDVSATRGEYLALKGIREGHFDGELWVLPASGVPRRVGDIVAREAAWSADGKAVVYTNETEIWIANRDGTAARQLPTPPHGGVLAGAGPRTAR